MCDKSEVRAISSFGGLLRPGASSVWGRCPPTKALAVIGLAAVGRAIGQAGLATNGGILAGKLVPGADAVSAGARSLLVLALLSVAAIVVKTLCSAALAHTGKRVTGKMGANLRGAVLRGMLHGEPRGADAVPQRPQALHIARQRDHGLHGQGMRLGALTDHLREAEDALLHGALRWVASLLEILALAIALVMISARLSLFAFCFFIVLVMPVTLFRKRMRRALEQSNLAQDAVRERVVETVHALDLLRVSGAGHRTASRLASLSDALTRNQAWIALRAALLSGANELAAALALALMLAAFKAEHNMLRFFITMVLCYKPLRDLGDARSALQRGEIAIEALRPYLDKRYPMAESVTHWTYATLRVDNLETLSGRWNLELAPGSKLVLRGATGSGKTTFLRTLLGLTPALGGALRYGDLTLASDGIECPPGPNARPFAWLPQETPVLIGTLRDNIRPQDDAPVGKQSSITTLLGDLQRRDDDLGTLSGGERQLLGLARALESDAPILLLDEPTAALDLVTKQQVLAVLEAERRTMIVATHDPDVEQIATHRAAQSDDGTMTSVLHLEQAHRRGAREPAVTNGCARSETRTTH
jgi:ABC-type multidrug transport system fused ATPase/permease subunit